MKKRIEPYRGLLELKRKNTHVDQSIFELETNIQNFQNNDLTLLKEMQEFLIEQRQISQMAQNLSLEIMDKGAKLSDCSNNIQRSSNIINNLASQIEQMKNSKDNLMRELKDGKKSSKKPSSDSSKLMQDLEGKKHEVISLRMKLNSIQNELDNNKIVLQSNILPREQELEDALLQKESNSSVKPRRSKRGSAGVRNMVGYDQELVIEKQQELDKISDLIDQFELALEELQKNEIESGSERAEVDDVIVDKVVQIEKLNVDRRNINDRMALDKLEDLKSKSDSDFIEANSNKTNKLDDLIRKKAQDIKDIEKQGNQSHMYGFFLRMKEQFEDVKKKVDRLGDVKDKINDILGESDQSKNVAIQNSLKKLSKKFQEYFTYFVKDAETSIKFIRSTLDTKDEVEIKKEESMSGDIKHSANTYDVDTKAFTIGDHQYTGISVKVGFKDKNRMQSLKELSGGEKTVVALSLLFALNSLTSSQVYLLDEVDSALDQVYRAGLTEMLSKISSGGSTQFFTTTFNQELIDSVDNIYKVEFRNLQSKIAPCTKTRALEVLKKVSEEKKEDQSQ